MAGSIPMQYYLQEHNIMNESQYMNQIYIKNQILIEDKMTCFKKMLKESHLKIITKNNKTNPRNLNILQTNMLRALRNSKNLIIKPTIKN
jgi:hypothetical protein